VVAAGASPIGARRTHRHRAGLHPPPDPTYELLGEEGLTLIEAKADQILDEVGMEIRDTRSLALFAAAGAGWTATTSASTRGWCVACARPHHASSPSTPATRPTTCRSAAIMWCSRAMARRSSTMSKRPAVRIARRLQNFVKLDLGQSMAAPQRRHRVRAGRRARQQAPPRHGVGPSAL